MPYSLPNSTKIIFFSIFLLSSLLSTGQDIYVGSKPLSQSSGNEGKTYYYTKDVTLKDGFEVSGASGGFSIVPVATNPPPSPSQNYVRVEVPNVEVSSEYDLALLASDHKATSYSYIDGLGREIQKIQVQGSPSKQDIIQPLVYDNSGRQPVEYLPYTKGNSGAYRGNAVTDQSNYEQKIFYENADKIDHDSRPFTEHTFDNSPLNRVISSYLPGIKWKVEEKNVENIFEVNVVNEVRKWTITSGGLPSSTTTYSANQLSVEVAEGEDGQITKEYKNGRNQLILSRIKASDSPITWYDTYYIYDDLGNLRFVIPPKLVAADVTPSQKLIRALAFEYVYDNKQRLIKRFVPGAVNPNSPSTGEPILIVYDRWNRQIMTQDGVQRSKSPNEWTYTKYDQLNRPIITGIYTSNLSRSEIQEDVNAIVERYELRTINDLGYTINQTYPTNPSVDKILSITFYDDYRFKDASWSGLFFSSQGGDFESYYYKYVKGQITGSKVRGIGNEWLRSIVYYDKKYRTIQSVSENHLNGNDRVSFSYDFSGNIINQKTQHSAYGDLVTILKEFEYDHVNRPLKEYCTINNGVKTLVSENEYNELGEIVEKNLHSVNNGASFLQSVDQRYNIRGWLTDINHHKLSNDGTINDDSNDLFGMRLSYNQDQYTINSNVLDKQYSGNIAGVKWSTNNLEDPIAEQGYTYDYDLSNRLEAATYGMNTGSDANFGGTQFYSMDASYDENGNIMSLSRNGNLDGSLIPQDNMVYAYEDGDESNRLLRVTDNGDDDKGFKDTGETGRIYWYDRNGNLIADNYKGIVDIDYNYLNLPTLVTFLDGKTVKYEYNGIGIKLRKTVTKGNVPSETDYLGIAQYKEGELEFLFGSEGRILKHANDFNYEYFLKDHLGNTRVTFGNLPERKEVLATMESENAAYEESEFAFPSHPEIRTSTYNASLIQNHTPLGDESLALNGTVNGRVLGPAKVLNITSGDIVEVEVWAKYEDSGWNNSSIPDIITVLSAAFGTTSAGTGAEGASGAYNSALNLGSPGIYSGNANGQPEAYLQYLFFDSNHNYVQNSTYSNFQEVGAASSGNFAKLSSGKITFSQNGYLLVYVVNESNQNKEVYFDDLKIVQESSATSLKVSQASDYYPFGGMFNEYSYGFDQRNAYLYNGKEKQEETAWYDYGARMYNYELGRWHNLDKLADKYTNLSPYNYVMGNPINAIDPDGRLIIFVGGLRLNVGAGDQSWTGIQGIGVGGRQDIYRSDIFNYWSRSRNTFGRSASIDGFFQNLYKNDRSVYLSGSSTIRSQASDRVREGGQKAKEFHRKVEKGEISISEGETIKIVAHSQGGAHAVGFANQLMKYKDEEGNSTYNIEIIWYITPHQPTDINHPEGVIGIQASHQNDAVSGEGAPWWLPNGGSKHGSINGVDGFYDENIMGGAGQPAAEGPNKNRSGHNVYDNLEYLKNVINNFCEKNPDKCSGFQN